MKVKIKTWGMMQNEFGLKKDMINCTYYFIKEMETTLQEKYPNRIIEVSEGIDDKTYNWDAEDWTISSDMIEEYVKE